MSKGWDSTTLKKLKALTGKGLSTAEIGKRLGLSKNAVVGKLNRLGWNSKAGTVADAKPAAKPTATKRAAPKKAPAPVAPRAVKKAAPVTPAKKVATPVKKPVAKVAAPAVKSSKSSSKTLAMHQRIIQHSLEMANLKPGQCRWPIGDPDSENFHFCGDTVFVGKPYCYEHCRQAYQFNPPKKK